MEVEKRAIGRLPFSGGVDQGQFNRVPTAFGPTQERCLGKVAKNGGSCFATVVGDLARAVHCDHQDELFPAEPRRSGGITGGDFHRPRVAAATPVDARHAGRRNTQSIGKLPSNNPEILTSGLLFAKIAAGNIAVDERRAGKYHCHAVPHFATRLTLEVLNRAMPIVTSSSNEIRRDRMPVCWTNFRERVPSNHSLPRTQGGS